MIYLALRSRYYTVERQAARTQWVVRILFPRLLVTRESLRRTAPSDWNPARRGPARPSAGPGRQGLRAADTLSPNLTQTASRPPTNERAVKIRLTDIPPFPFVFQTLAGHNHKRRLVSSDRIRPHLTFPTPPSFHHRQPPLREAEYLLP